MIRRGVCLVPWDFLALLACLVAVQASYLFDSSFVPTHDTFGQLTVFQYFYRGFFHDLRLPLWCPYVGYGMPTLLYQLAALSPANYTAILIGRGLGIEDVLVLYKWSVFGEFLVLLLGTYLLARALFRHRVTVFIVCLICTLTPVYYSQIFMTLRMIYLLPFMLYLLLRFFWENRPDFLWLCGVTALVSLLGMNAYFAGLYLLTLTLFAIPMLLKHGLALRSLWELTWTNGACLLLFVFLAGLVMHSWSEAIEGLYFTSPGRDPLTGKTSLQVFLTYARIDWAIPLTTYLKGWPLFLDANLYIGILPWILLSWAVWRVRSPLLASLLLTAGVLLGLATSEMVARILYHFPLMGYYRHISYVYSIANIFIVLAAGLGLDDFLDVPAALQANFLCLALVVLVVPASLALSLSFPFHSALADTSLDGLHGNGIYWLRIIAYLFVLVVPAILVTHGYAASFKWLPALLIVAVIVDLGSFQALAMRTYPRLTAEQRACLALNPITYVSTRTEVELKALPRPSATIYNFQYQFEGVDPYEITTRVESLPEEFPTLLRCRNLASLPMGDTDLPVQRTFGHHAPKLRICAQAIVANSYEDARQLVSATANIDEAPILYGAASTEHEPDAPTPETRPEDEIAVLRFAANELVVRTHVEGHAPKWLYYADAFHPAWEATVNGKHTTVYAANLLFKAVSIPPGNNIVHLRFGDTNRRFLSWLLAAVGCLFYVACVSATMAHVCLRDPIRCEQQQLIADERSGCQ